MALAQSPAVTSTASDDDPRSRLDHADPPCSPSQVLLTPWTRLAVVAAVFVVLGLATIVARGTLLGVDQPIEEWVIDRRSPWLDRAFRIISFLGSTKVVLAGGMVLAVIAWRRCRVVAALVLVATVTRPLFEHVLKLAFDRERPDIDRMVAGNGPSYPSGHVMAAAALWLMVPVALSLFHSSRRLWWASLGAALSIVALIGASRVYLGVHWPTDVLGGALAAALLLTALDAGYRALHGSSLTDDRQGLRCRHRPSSDDGQTTE
jgi:undecaprenyl-diphosphatase